MKIKYLLQILCYVFAYSSALYALESDSEQPLRIEANVMEFTEQTNISQYQGQVKIQQGSINILAEQVTVTSNNKELKLLEMIGNKKQQPSFTQLTDAGNKVTASAKRIEYWESESLLKLYGNATLSKGDNRIKSQYIQYNTEQHAILSGAETNTESSSNKNADKERVHISIKPKDK